MLHVAILFEFASLNGGERSMLAVMGELAENSLLEFSAIAPEHGNLADELRRLDIPVSPFTTRDADGKRPAEEIRSALQRIIDKTRPDILHANSLSMSRLTGQLQNPNVKRTGHLRDIIKLNKTVISDLNQNDALIAVSRATRDFHIQQGLQADRCRVVYNGVDLKRFVARNKSNIRHQLFPEIPASAQLLLNVGQICLRKDQLTLARAVCKLLEERDDIFLLMAGARFSEKAESRAFESAIKNEFQLNGKSAHLRMLGQRDDVHLLMNSADLLVHTAKQEPLGRTLLEAAASGLPIVATDVGGTSEILAHDREAVLITPGDTSTLTTAISRLLDDPSLKSSLAAAARTRMAEHFNVDEAAGNLVDFWLQLANK